MHNSSIQISLLRFFYFNGFTFIEISVDSQHSTPRVTAWFSEGKERIRKINLYLHHVYLFILENKKHESITVSSEGRKKIELWEN